VPASATLTHNSLILTPCKRSKFSIQQFQISEELKYCNISCVSKLATLATLCRYDGLNLMPSTDRISGADNKNAMTVIHGSHNIYGVQCAQHISKHVDQSQRHELCILHQQINNNSLHQLYD